MTMASAQAVLRVSSDNHYLTDVMLGAALGIGSGYFLPWFLHYRGSKTRSVALAPSFLDRSSGLAFLVAPALSPDMVGATIVGGML